MFAGTLIPTRSISRLRTFQVSKKSQRAAAFAAISALSLICAGITLYHPVRGLEQALPIGLGMVGIGFAIGAINSYMFKRYGLSIETNGGTRDFIHSGNKRFAQEILENLVVVIGNLESPRAMTINMNNNTIEGDTINQKGVFGVGVQKAR
jgi:D-arabinose 1-dehydrogenase-like Zn-dependent alcohol dehydrogenase